MAQRIQSPSSINTYKRCPRKYYYQYILKFPTIKTIHLIRGKIVHSILEKFFKIDISNISQDHHYFELKILLQSLLKQEWEKSKQELLSLNLSEKELEFYFEESKEMLFSWHESFVNRIKLKQNNNLTFSEAFNLLKPKTEMYFISDEHQVQGYIDAIHDINGEISLIDYKTSKKDQISSEFKLQLAIYALLYYERYKKHPDLVGVDFLKHGPKYLKVDANLLEMAKEECKLIQEKTLTEDIWEYPMKTSPLCKWNGGQCDFYDVCFGQKKINEFKD